MKRKFPFTYKIHLEILSKIGLSLLYLVIAGVITGIYIGNSNFNANVRDGYVHMVYQRVDKPFVYRILVPLMIRGTSKLIPDRFEQRINRRLPSGSTALAILRKLNWEPQYLSLYLIGVFFLYCFMIGFMVAFRELFKTFFLSSSSFLNFVPIIASICFLPLTRWTYIYDIPSLFLFTLGFTFLARRKWTAFLVTFILGCLNKETILLLTLLFIIYFGLRRNLTKQLFFRLLFSQLIIFLVIKLILGILFKENGGRWVEFHLLDHNWGVISDWVGNYSANTFYLILLLMISVFYHWNEQPQFLRDGLWILFTLIGLALVFGWINEWRDYLEAYPIIAALFLHNFARWINIPIKINEDLNSRA
jgi:hypothetical protein